MFRYTKDTRQKINFIKYNRCKIETRNIFVQSFFIAKELADNHKSNKVSANTRMFLRL